MRAAPAAVVMLAAATLAAAAGAFGPAAADAPRDRLLGAVARHAAVPAALERRIGAHCPAAEARCAAALLAAHLPGARFVRVAHPDADSIRRARTVPSVGAASLRADGALVVALDRFGRKADREVADAVAAGGGTPRLALDLRANAGGDFDRMTRVASLFTGPRAAAIRVSGRAGITAVALPPPLRAVETAALEVLIGPRTASSAEVLAALLRRHAGARLVGARSRGKDRLARLIPVDHDWRLSVPAGRIEVPGETLAGGLVPDVPTPGDGE